jgi:hypothetical protein
VAGVSRKTISPWLIRPELYAAMLVMPPASPDLGVTDAVEQRGLAVVDVTTVTGAQRLVGRLAKRLLLERGSGPVTRWR